jgi:uncharacterized protein YjbJ (UPF0337 family)
MRDKAEGKLKEAEGKLTNDELREKQGQTRRSGARRRTRPVT